ncbi:MAG: aspartate aminotransferase family protein [Candidatus Latescibacteria bacterium]|nr:aspartate aminotransferase family protein [Candidatus Latescibacterota bacterium]
MKTDEIIDFEQKYILQTYRRPPIVLERGNGVYLFDTDGRRYLDFVSGLSVNAFGYGDQEVVEAMVEQAKLLIHSSNLYHTIPAPRLAKLLVEHSCADRVFFCNSGTEANEAAIKFARRWGYDTSPDRPKFRILAFYNSFHGRTCGSLALTGQEKYHHGFGPLLPGADFATFNDLTSVDVSLTDDTCAVIVEPLQAEGGIHVATQEFLSGLRRLCDERGMLLIFDEVQCGLGRMGSLFAYQQYAGVEPDIVTLAKPLGGGLPLGVTLVREKVAAHLHPGDHAATFGANPVICAVAVRVLKRLMSDEFLLSVKAKGDYLIGKLHGLASQYPLKVQGVRGCGLIAGLVVEGPPGEIVDACRERGVLVVAAGTDVVRLLPPLIVEQRHIDEAIAVLDQVLR